MEYINGPDIFILVVILLSALLSYNRGFTREMLGIGSWILATILTIYGVPFVCPFVEKYFTNLFIANILSYIIVFFTSLILLTLVYSRIAKVVQRSDLRGLDNFLGFLFGVVRGLFLLVLFFLFISVLTPKGLEDFHANSKMLPFLEQIAQSAKAQIMQETQDTKIEVNIPGYKKPENVEDLLHLLDSQKQEGPPKRLFDLDAIKESFSEKMTKEKNEKKEKGQRIPEPPVREEDQLPKDTNLRKLLEESSSESDDNLFQMLNAPAVKTQEREGKSQGYDEKEREDLNRLIMEATDDFSI